MQRREWLRRTALLGGGLILPSRLRAWSSIPRAGSLLIPMDGTQQQQLKAYGVVFRALTRGEAGEWLLNYRGGSFLVPASAGIQRDATLEGVSVIPVDPDTVTTIKGEILASNMEALPLDKAPRMAVYVPGFAAPWDDAVSMALEFAGIEFDKVWDPEVIGDRLARYDWLHLHHEDFTGQFSKFGSSASGTDWMRAMTAGQQQAVNSLGFASVPALKRAVAQRIAGFVDRGGFLFAMCTATETLDLALASEGVSIVASGGSLPPGISQRLHWEHALAFQGAELELSSGISVFSDIDGHQVNGAGRQELGAFTLFNFSAKIDPVASMLVQNHRRVIPDFYGLTTSFRRSRLKPAVTILGDEPGAPWAKYIHGDRGKGTWTFYGGHDPEDPHHAIGDPPTDLSLHPDSPGYRLILNNVLFPAAKKQERKT